MLSLLVDCAVAFGCAAAANGGGGGGGSSSATATQSLRNPARQAPLPDVILSNTLPPSPLRGAHPNLTLFPGKAQRHLQDANSLVTSPQGDEPLSTFRVSSGGDGKERVRTGLDHIKEVRRKIRCGPVQPHHDLPNLSWQIPHLQHKHDDGKSGEEGEGSGRGGRQSKTNEGGKQTLRGGEEKVHEESRWRSIGGDLRRIADQFRLKNSKRGRKSEGPSPPTRTRCIAGFFFSLLRLVSTFQQVPPISEDFTATHTSFFTSLASLWTFLRIFRSLTS